MPNCNAEGCTTYIYRISTYCQPHRTRVKRHGYPELEFQQHGLSKTKEYRIWSHMKARCYNPNVPEFKYYGGKGVEVCDRWRYSFELFVMDMGNKPDKLSLDRIDGNGNYEPSNCRWATIHQQIGNRSNSNKTPGVSFDKFCGRWDVRLYVDRKCVYRRSYKTEAEAIKARKRAELLYLPQN